MVACVQVRQSTQRIVEEGHLNCNLDAWGGSRRKRLRNTYSWLTLETVHVIVSSRNVSLVN